MAFGKVLILCFSLISAASDSQFIGVVTMFRPRGRNPDETIRVDFRTKSGFDYSYPDYLYWYCSSGNCGTVVSSSSGIVDRSVYTTRWSQTEKYEVLRLTSDKPFSFSHTSCCWISNTLNHNGWNMETVVDLGTRSDTSKPNHSPVTTILPIIRVPQNCPTSFALLTHDPDGDIVRCRYGQPHGECSTCYKHPDFNLNEENCILSTSSSMRTGVYVFELVVQDFPRNNIVLRYNDGSVSYKYRSYVRNNFAAAKNPRWWGHTYTAATSDDVSAVSHFETSVEEEVSAISHFETSVTEEEVSTGSHFETSVTEEVCTVSHYETTNTDTISKTETESTWKTTSIHSTEETTTKPTQYTTRSSATTTFPPGDSLSKIPFQFMVDVTDSLSSCTYGVYRPLLLHPTPNHGEILNARASTPFRIHLSAQASHSSITDFKVSGPHNMTKGTIINSVSSTTMIIEWTPTDNDVGDHVPFCFVAETSIGYYSELRCIIVIVGPHRLVNTALICNENTMTLFIEKSSVNGLYENHLRLNDHRCLLSSNSTHHIASVGFNSCGTQIEETEDSIVFKNQVTSFDNITDVITRKHQVVIPFNCSFPKENRLSVSFRPQKAIYEFTEAGFGTFSYKFQFYTDDRFITVQTKSPLEVMLRDMLYLEIEVTSTVPNVQLFVESCKATPHDNPNDPVFYDIIENGCLMDETLVIYPTTSTKSRFGLEAFTFIGNYEEVYVSCTVMLCKFGDPNTRCSRGCATRSLSEPEENRRRRSLTREATESLQHFISQGPLRMKRQSSSEGAEGKVSLNANTLVMSLSGVAIVAIVGITIFFSIKKSKMMKYERLSTEEL